MKMVSSAPYSKTVLPLEIPVRKVSHPTVGRFLSAATNAFFLSTGKIFLSAITTAFPTPNFRLITGGESDRQKQLFPEGPLFAFRQLSLPYFQVQSEEHFVLVRQVPDEPS